MHLSEGIASAPALMVGAFIAIAGIGVGLRSMRVDKTPETAMLAALFFVASLIRIPFGPSGVHLVLNGLAGILLGWSVFPALATALLMQALIFQFGGLTALGINICVMALPAIPAYYIFQLARGARPMSVTLIAAGLGAFTVLGSGLLLAAVLRFGGREFSGVAAALLIAHLPVMFTDGLITAAAIGFLIKIRPDLLWQKEGRCESCCLFVSGEGLK